MRRKSNYLLACDFDGTIADTFSPSPNNITVLKSYENAVGRIFGQEGLRRYEEIGRLQNRAPGELTEAILADNARGILIENARNYFLSAKIQLEKFVPKGKGYRLEWEEGEKDNGQLIREVITEILVRCKLIFLMEEIGVLFSDGSSWPRPCAGFLSFFKALERLNRNENIRIWLAIISSGHENFIKETFASWGIACPQIILTDDDMRRRKYKVKLANKIKPSPFLFDLIHSAWVEEFAGENALYYTPGLIGIIRKSFKRMIFIGDDPEKDGKLAENAEVPFGWFNPVEREIDESGADSQFTFQNWEVLGKFLTQQNVRSAMNKNAPFRQILKLREV